MDYLYSKNNQIWDSNHDQVVHSLDQPLCNYWMASSHNTWVILPRFDRRGNLSDKVGCFYQRFSRKKNTWRYFSPCQYDEFSCFWRTYVPFFHQNRHIFVNQHSTLPINYTFTRTVVRCLTGSSLLLWWQISAFVPRLYENFISILEIKKEKIVIKPYILTFCRNCFF